jgi:hypothetical protein
MKGGKPMEEQWYVDRMALHRLRQTHPSWSKPELAQAVHRSVSWVKKWCHRLDQAGGAIETVLHGLPRGRRTPAAGFSETVIERVLEIRAEPPEGLQRIPGPETILYYLNRDEGLKAALSVSRSAVPVPSAFCR